MEFWQGRKGRMHDRLVYRRAADDPSAPWTVERLAPDSQKPLVSECSLT